MQTEGKRHILQQQQIFFQTPEVPDIKRLILLSEKRRERETHLTRQRKFELSHFFPLHSGKLEKKEDSSESFSRGEERILVRSVH